jgi:hypothetical protein
LRDEMLLCAAAIAMQTAGYSTRRAARLIGALGLDVETFCRFRRLLAKWSSHQLSQ